MPRSRAAACFASGLAIRAAGGGGSRQDALPALRGFRAGGFARGTVFAADGSILKRLFQVLAFGFALLFAAQVLAAGEGTRDEARAMAIAAAAYLKENGAEKAFAAFSAPGAPWHDRDLYVFVQDGGGVMRMHGNNPGLVGKSMLALKDPNGRSLSFMVTAIENAGWIEFQWQNPITKRIEPKADYIIRAGEYWVGVGAYAR